MIKTVKIVFQNEENDDRNHRPYYLLSRLTPIIYNEVKLELITTISAEVL